jgi:hypothetical protein
MKRKQPIGQPSNQATKQPSDQTEQPSNQQSENGTDQERKRPIRRVTDQTTKRPVLMKQRGTNQSINWAIRQLSEEANYRLTNSNQATKQPDEVIAEQPVNPSINPPMNQVSMNYQAS